MTDITDPNDFPGRHLNDKQLRVMNNGLCPDCKTETLMLGPRGGTARNIACSQCGNEFTFGRGPISGMMMGQRNHPKDEINHKRLKEVYNIELRG